TWPPAARRELLNARAFFLLWSRRWDEQWATLEEILRLARADGDVIETRRTLAKLADLALVRGDAEQAIRRGRELVALERRERSNLGQAHSFAFANLGAA